MSPLVSSFVTFSCILHTMLASIDPTTLNSTGLFWRTSDSTSHFAADSITCSASYCHIACDSDIFMNNCASLSIYATSSLTTLVIQCTEDSSCDSIVIYANTANAVNVSCDDYACPDAKLYVGNVQNGVIIDCKQQGCPDAYIDASNIGNSLTVTCADLNSCRDTDIYCPNNVPCNIYCTGDNACRNANCHVPTRWDKTLNSAYLCSNTSSYVCEGANVVCQDTDLTSALVFNDSKWECADYGCCPYESVTISCVPGLSCQIDCDIQICNDRYINATEATSLAMDCGTNGCQDATIQCPTS
eukprot:194657_1